MAEQGKTWKVRLGLAKNFMLFADLTILEKKQRTEDEPAK